MVIVAPTGLAAVNVGGQTIHSFFGFPPRLIRPDDIRRSRNGRLMRRLKFLVIDEVSMVRSDIMWAIDQSLRVNRGRPREPFGGVRLAMFGDLHQLPPVIDEAEVAVASGIGARRAVLLQRRGPARGHGHRADRADAGVPAEGRGADPRPEPGARRRRGRGRPGHPQRARASHPHAGRRRALCHPHAHQCGRAAHQHGLSRSAAERGARIPGRRDAATSTRARSPPMPR